MPVHGATGPEREQAFRSRSQHDPLRNRSPHTMVDRSAETLSAKLTHEGVTWVAE
jgi:hypothetical protein